MERFTLILFLSILITMVKTTSIVSQDISMQSKYLANQKKKIKRRKSSAQYYSNYIATYRIILSSNIETNLGPGLSKPKCQVCNKTVRCNQNTSNKVHEWTCLNCVHTALPFYNCRNLDFDSNVAYKTTILHIINSHIETLKNYQKYTSITHINFLSIL